MSDQPDSLTWQVSHVVTLAQRAGCGEAVEWICRVYGSMEDPLKVSQEIRARTSSS